MASFQTVFCSTNMTMTCTQKVSCQYEVLVMFEERIGIDSLAECTSVSATWYHLVTTGCGLWLMVNSGGWVSSVAVVVNHSMCGNSVARWWLVTFSRLDYAHRAGSGYFKASVKGIASTNRKCVAHTLRRQSLRRLAEPKKEGVTTKRQYIIECLIEIGASLVRYC